MTVKEAKKLVKQRLSEERFYHTKCVARAAKKLAPQFGADVDKAVLAAWLHDILKEDPKPDLLKRVQASAIIFGYKVEESPQLWHAFAGGDYVEQELGVDPEIASAVRWHTTGKPDMTPLEKTVFLADYISDDRHFTGVEEIRELSYRSAEKGLRRAMKQTIDHLREKGLTVNENTIEALEYLETHDSQENQDGEDK